MHRALALLAVAAAGCDDVFGIHHLTDENAPVVTGHYHQVYAVNDATFQPVIMDRLVPVGTIALAAILDDGSEPSVDYLPDGTFSFPLERPGQSYRFAITADGNRQEVQSSSPQLQLFSMSPSRSDRNPVLPTTVQFGYPIAGVATGAAYIATTGIRTVTPTGLVGPTVTFDWRLSQPTFATGMLDAGKNDRIYTIEYGPFGTDGYTAMHSVGAASITQVGNQPSTAATPAAVTHDRCVRFTAANLTEHDRVVAAQPDRMYTTSIGDWYVFDVPSFARMNATGAIQLALLGQTPTFDSNPTPTFYDPFPGGDYIVEAGGGALYTLSLPGTTTPFTLAGITRRYRLAESGSASSCASPVVDLTPTIGIPGVTSIDGTSLDRDGTVVALDLSRDVPVTWTLGAPGPVDFMTVALYEVTAAGSATNVVYRTGFFVVGQAGVLDHTMLLPDHAYILNLQTHITYPDAAAGDFETMSESSELSSNWSHYFQVTAR